ncbi:BRAP2 RING ZnF UBP domain-containing protein 2-like [Curcuma longa]|uniref:BRAP2 RING ZnF UBP domain-containing protein 2-like n=1 Tax=Curcuma longa TaxID=136217 RepID=UPI003D9E2916
MNYQMNHLESTIPELINMLKTVESSIKKEQKAVMVIDSSKKGSKKRKSKDQAKEKKKAKKEELTPKGLCHHCGKVGHWRRNCKIYLESMKKKASDAPSTSGSMPCDEDPDFDIVCHFCQKHSDKPTCSICGTPENLWICVICGFVGCGRYEEGHAIRHWKDTQHCYSLDMETQRVWDYVGDNYVHRLNQSRSDNKLAKLNSNSRPSGKNCIPCGCSDDVGISEAILSSKVQMIVDEYNHLLASQLENQKQYYEAIVQKEKENKKKYIADAVEKAVSLKLQDIQHKIHDVTKEKKVAVDVNANLMKNQKLWQEKIKEIEERYISFQ